MPLEERYVCTGGCGANLTLEQYRELKELKCQSHGCTGHGKPFVYRRWCTDCKTHLEPGTPAHQH